MKRWGLKGRSDSKNNDQALRDRVLQEARLILSDEQPRTARQLASILSSRGLVVHKSLVNSVLHKEGRKTVIYDRTTSMYWVEATSLSEHDSQRDDGVSGNIDVSQQEDAFPPDQSVHVNPVPKNSFPKKRFRQLIVEILSELGTAAISDLVEALHAKSHEVSALEVLEQLHVLRQEGIIAQPIIQPDSTPSDPRFLYCLADTSIAKNKPNRARTPTADSESICEYIVAVFDERESATLNELIDDIYKLTGIELTSDEVYEHLKTLYRSGILAKPEVHPSSIPGNRILSFRLKRQRSEDHDSTSQPQPHDTFSSDIDNLIIQILRELGSATIAQIAETLALEHELHIDRLTIHERLAILRRQGHIAEPQPHPSSTPHKPLFLYQLRNVDRLPQYPSASPVETASSPPASSSRQNPASRISNRPRFSGGIAHHSDLRSHTNTIENDAPTTPQEKSVDRMVPESDLRAVIVDHDENYVVISAEIDNHAFFNIRTEGNVTYIVLNTRHPLHDQLADILKASADGDDSMLIRRLATAGETLKLLLIAWAEFENRHPSRKVRERAENARSDWGRILKQIVRRNGNL